MRRIWLTIIIVFYTAFALSSVFIPYGEQHFSFLSLAFLEGRLDLNGYPLVWNDIAIFNGNKYLPLGPFPAVLITPFVFIWRAFGGVFFHRYIHGIFVLGVFFLLYKISRHLKYGVRDSFFWAFAFNLGSAFVAISINGWSWSFAQVITVFLIFYSLYEFITRKRFLLIGIMYAMILATRATAVIGIIYYFLEIVFSKETTKRKINNTALLVVPIICVTAFLMLYNFLRFGNLFEQGYMYQQIYVGLRRARDLGLISFVHIPGNLYYLFLASPTQVFMDGLSKTLKFPFITYDTWGLGIFYTSPYLLTLFTYKFRERSSRLLLITTLLVLIPVIMYYGIGVNQFGYRYALDFMPYVFFILMKDYKSKILSFGFRAVVVFSILFNFYLLFSKSFI